jgi:hypothetical protein
MTASDTPTSPVPDKPSSGAPRLIRRVHMYLGLFLAPWMLMYALSTLAMAHRPFFQSFYATERPKFTVEREMDYSRTFAQGATTQEKARQILQDLGLEGRHGVPNVRDGAPIVINRQHALSQRRIRFDPATSKITVEREEFRGLNFLERMHRRRGFQDPYVTEDTWAFSVDLTVLTLVFWGLSGIWLWWGVRQTRLWGAVSLAFGIVLFATFLALI